MRTLLPALMALLLLSGCGYVLYPDPVEFAGAPKWHAGEKFYIFENEPTNSFKQICRILAASDAGDYPSWEKRIKIAKQFATEHGGNGVILGRGNTASSNALNVIRVIYLEK